MFLVICQVHFFMLGKVESGFFREEQSKT